MAVITLKISEQEKKFLQSMAKFEGKTLSELIREKTLNTLEEEYDAKVSDMRLEEYEEYLASGGKVLKWDNL
ncbi:MAG: DUF6290 family protein [Leptotrichiaceae bacterium]|nr:DUF6290 family protein [Leptotrichiaceae bacterium]